MKADQSWSVEVLETIEAARAWAQRRHKAVGTAAALLLTTATVLAVARPGESEPIIPQPTEAIFYATASEPQEIILQEQSIESPAVTIPALPPPLVVPETVPELPSTTTTQSIPTTTSLSPASPPITAEMIVPPDTAAEAAINAVQLTPEGYGTFAGRIDNYWFDYAQRLVEFNPGLVAIEQGISEWFVWHFTVSTYDGNGITLPPEQTDVQRFIDSLAGRYGNGGQCCGVNWFIDRYGTVRQLAPLNAKLDHDPPYSSRVTGVEVEAASQTAITTAQYESLAYLTIAVLQNQGLLDPAHLEQRVHGHGEDRDAYLLEHPDSQLGIRNDFDAPAASLLRAKITEFLTAYPETLQLTPVLR